MDGTWKYKKKHTAAGSSLLFRGQIQPSVKQRFLKEKEGKINIYNRYGTQRRNMKIKVTINVPRQQRIYIPAGKPESSRTKAVLRTDVNLTGIIAYWRWVPSQRYLHSVWKHSSWRTFHPLTSSSTEFKSSSQTKKGTIPCKNNQRTGSRLISVSPPWSGQWLQ